MSSLTRQHLRGPQLAYRNLGSRRRQTTQLRLNRSPNTLRDVSHDTRVALHYQSLQAYRKPSRRMTVCTDSSVILNAIKMIHDVQCDDSFMSQLEDATWNIVLDLNFMPYSLSLGRQRILIVNNNDEVG